MHSPLDADPPQMKTLPGCRPCLHAATPLDAEPPPPGQTNTCENITLCGKNKQECIPVGYILLTLYHKGSLPDRDPGQRPPVVDLDADPPVGRPPPRCEQTDRCKNITLPQTSFAADNMGSQSNCVLVSETI